MYKNTISFERLPAANDAQQRIGEDASEPILDETGEMWNVSFMSDAPLTRAQTGNIIGKYHPDGINFNQLYNACPDCRCPLLYREFSGYTCQCEPD